MEIQRSRWFPVLASVLLTCALAPRAGAQQILLDKPVKAGELTLFPDLNNESIYYYVPDKARVATDANGTPQFSFLRYVENVRSGGGQPEAREGEGGGIVHALVTLGVTPEQLADANRELQRVKAGARIQGPIVFKSGRFALVSSVTDTKGNMSKQVVGLGNAPLLDGEKAGISIELTKLGSKILWESFEMPAPDISFRFEMDLSGFRAPRRAIIDADWSKVYSHRAFSAGIATRYLAAEVNDALTELRTSDAIKITQIGTDEKMDAVIETAYKMIQDRMFEPTSGAPSLSSMTTAGAGQTSMLDRATARLKEAEAAIAAENARIRGENKETQTKNDKAHVDQAQAAGLRAKAEQADLAAERAEVEAAAALNRAELAEQRLADAQKPAGPDVIGEPAPEAVDYARKEAAELRKRADAARAEALRLRDEASKTQVAAAVGSVAAPEPQALRQEQEAPSLSVVAMLEMRKVKQSGTFHMDLNKYVPESMTLSFSENIGDLRRLKQDEAHFRQVNLDDPLFKQREIVAMVDGLDSKDFGQFVNFVDVRMRKKHAEGDESADEVRVDRDNFNKDGNHFKLLYGWKNDTDRRKWMEYEVQTTWNFVGGKTVVEPWRKTTSGTLALAPPYRRRTVMLDGTAETLQQSDVRAVTVKLFYDLAGSEQSKQVTLNIAKGLVAEKLEFLAPPEAPEYAYEITWQLKGNKSLTQPRQKGISDVVFVDELPSH